jgi:hypothetical protein
MKKKTLALLLCLAIPTTIPATAQAADAPALLVEALSATPVAPIGDAEVRAAIRTAAARPDRYLSLGETHLFAELDRRYLESLAREYLDAAPAPVHTCAEDLSEPVDQLPIYQYLSQASASFWLSPGNGPSQTNFRPCNDAGKRWLTYSGLFHQYPLPRVFPADFEATPVSQKPGNTIWSQLSSQQGVFVTMMDLVYVQNQTTNGVLHAGWTAPGPFRARVRQLEGAFTRLKGRLGLITDRVPELAARSPLRGAFFRKASLPAPSAADAIPADAYLLIVDPEFRYREPVSLPMLRMLAATDDAWLSRLLGTLRQPGTWVSFTNLFYFLDPQTLQPLAIHFGVLEDEFAPGTGFLTIDPQGADHQLILTSSPGESAARCFHVPHDFNQPARELPLPDCHF